MRNIVLILTLALPLAASALADTILVPADAPTIQAAIDLADPNDQVILADGVYTGPGNAPVNFNGKRLVLRSASGDPNACVIDANGGPAIRMISGESGAVVYGIGIHDYSQGIAMIDASPIIQNCRLVDGRRPISCFGGTCISGDWPRFLNCRVDGYSELIDARGVAITFRGCQFSGATNIGMSVSGRCVIDGCRFVNNVSTVGFQLSDIQASAIITNSIFEHNLFYNKLLYLQGQNSRMSVYRSWFLDNVATELADGSSGATWLFDHCVFARNDTIGFYSTGQMTFTNSLFVQNGRQFVNLPIILFPGPGPQAALFNCIYWNNSATGVARRSETVQYSIVERGWPDVGNIDADPMFVDPNNNDFRLRPGSPAIDAGTIDLPGICPQVDLALAERVFDDPNTPNTGFGAPIDIGPFEFGAPFRGGPTPCLADLTGDQRVDLSDLAQLIASYARDAAGDLTCDGQTDLADLAALLSFYGADCE
ncbi:MAG: right-handed parallel beta-helix repeat-containing protein [Phycisphaerales bacterium]|nr:right-handed parallel beta-helix repeat-containing protein [Phycisphaerales bacterium]